MEAKVAWVVALAAGAFLWWAFGSGSKTVRPAPTASPSTERPSYSSSPPKLSPPITIAPTPKVPSVKPVSFPSFSPPKPLPSYTIERNPAKPAYSSPSPYTGTTTTPSVAGTTLYRDASGRTYRVSDADYYRLLSRRQSLDMEQRRIDARERELEDLGSQIDRMRFSLDRTSQYAVDSFNRKVREINSLSDDLEYMVSSYNRQVDAFNAELERVGTPVR
jgi:hypothetical protein